MTVSKILIETCRKRNNLQSKEAKIQDKLKLLFKEQKAMRNKIEKKKEKG